MLNLLIHFFVVVISADTQTLADSVHKYARGEVDAQTAWSNTVAARLSETREVPASLLLSMAYSESRYNPYSVSHVRDGKRQGGIFKSDAPPSGISGPYFCGVTQVIANNSWKKCLEAQNLFVSYATSVRELSRWLKSPLCIDSDNQMQCALWGYGGGHQAIEARTSTYPARVLSRALALEKSLAPLI
jgi:hypothetical protein